MFESEQATGTCGACGHPAHPRRTCEQPVHLPTEYEGQGALFDIYCECEGYPHDR